MANRSKRKQIAEQTLEILDQGYYEIGREKVMIRDLIDRSVKASFCQSHGESSVISGKGSNKTTYSFGNETTFAGVRYLIEQGYERVTCLNFASAKNPGGGFLNGSQAQEEALARASGLYPTLRANRIYYDENRLFGNPLYSDHIIYSPQVPVFRNDEDGFLKTPYFTDIITAPAVNAGAVRHFHPELANQIETVMRNRIDLVLRLAIQQETEAIVLGAWGCGVFQNDPSQMANWFKQALQSQEIQNHFKDVRFSVKSNDEKTIKAFSRLAVG